MQNKIFYIIVNGLVFLLLPFASIILQIIILSLYKYRKYQVYFLIISITVFLALLNSTVIPSSDIINYYEWFHLADNFKINQYVFSLPSEPLFTSFTYITYHILNGNEKAYLFILTLGIYFPVNHSIFRFYYKKYCTHLLLALLIFSFFPQIFSLSNNIIRQMLAGGLLTYYLVEKEINKNNNIYIYVASVFIHSSALLFLPIIIFNRLVNKINLKILALLISILALVSLIYRIVLLRISELITNPVLSIALERVTREPHTIYDPPSLSVIIFSTIIFLVVIRFMIKFKDNRYSRFYLYYIFLYIFMIINYDNTQISARIVFYAYFFFPFVIPYALMRILNVKMGILNLILSLIMVGLFIFGYFNSIYEYEPGVRAFLDLISFQIIS